MLEEFAYRTLRLFAWLCLITGALVSVLNLTIVLANKLPSSISRDIVSVIGPVLLGGLLWAFLLCIAFAVESLAVIRKRQG